VRVLRAPAIEQHLRFAIGHIVAIFIRDEEKVWRRTDIDASEAFCDSGGKGKLFIKDGALVGPSVAVGVFEDEDLVVRLAGTVG
jgi:hypothetical protein